MTGSEIKTRAENLLLATIDNTVALASINEAIDKIAELGLVTDTLNGHDDAGTSSTKETWYALAANVVDVQEVEDSDGDTYDSYRIKPGSALEIWFKDTGVYTIYARKFPTNLSALSQDLKTDGGLHRNFHQPLVEFVRGVALIRDDEDSRAGLMYMERFEQAVLRAYRSVLRTNRNSQITVQRQA